MNAKDIRALSIPDLKNKIGELQKELVKERAQVALGSQLKSPRKIHQLRKTVARMLTVYNQQSKLMLSKKSSKSNEHKEGIKV